MTDTITRGTVFAQLRSQLRKLHYQQTFLDRVVPTWWTPEAETDSNGLNHLKLILAQNLGLDVPALLRDDIVKPVAPSGMRFKRSSDLQNERPADPNLAFLARIVKSVASAIPPSEEIPRDALAIHSEIIGKPARCPDLDAILDYCWSKNIGVVHVEHVPVKKKGLDAFVSRVNGRFVLVVTRHISPESSARASFLIAHELAHIATGDVTENLALVEDPSEHEKRKSEEKKADRFACRVLDGDRYQRGWARGAKRGETLAANAEESAQALNLDPGHVLLRWAFEKDAWSNAQNALGFLDHPGVPIASIINRIAHEHIRSSELSNDARDLIHRNLVA
jgi:hypothetical protein